MKTGKKGIDLIKKFEGCKLTGYKCPSGRPTIGYGHTGKIDGELITDETKITLGKALEILRSDLERFESAINNYVKTPITQNQFDSLVAFSFNVGDGAFIGSTLLRKLNARDYKGASAEFLKWNKATVNGEKVELKGLTNRRKAEQALFNAK